MKNLIIALFLTAFSVSVSAQTNPNVATEAKKITKQVAEVSCGQCQFKMKGKKSCDLAVRIDGVAYFVDGKNIDDFGDSHGEHGFCNAIGKAEVTGQIMDNRFKAKEIKLLPVKK